MIWQNGLSLLTGAESKFILSFSFGHKNQSQTTIANLTVDENFNIIGFRGKVNDMT